MNDHEQERHHERLLPLYFLSAVIAFSLCFAAGYGLSELIFRLTGQPTELFARIISGLLGLLVFIAVMTIIRFFLELHKRKYPERHLLNHSFAHSEFIKNTMDAMNRIARGDFNVLVTVDERDPFSEVAQSVNKMARELSSMEQIRQDFISNVSHEIQSPLTSISGFAALLKTDGLTEDTRAHYLEIIETESKRLSNLSANLLKLSALEAEAAPLAHQEYRLDKQIESVLLTLEPQWSSKNLSPNLTLSKTLFTGDEELMSQVWMNLLHNAVKFTPIGGEFGVSLTLNENKIVCAVFDNGVGIPAEDQIHIFERFYKADKSRDRSLGGNGLGLSLVKKIVELHGGAIDLQSEPGKGAVFTVHLPVKK